MSEVYCIHGVKAEDECKECEEATMERKESRVKSAQLERELTALKQTNAELVKDKERLDWMEGNFNSFYASGLFKPPLNKLREALSQGMTKAGTQ